MHICIDLHAYISKPEEDLSATHISSGRPLQLIYHFKLIKKLKILESIRTDVVLFLDLQDLGGELLEDSIHSLSGGGPVPVILQPALHTPRQKYCHVFNLI